MGFLSINRTDSEGDSESGSLHNHLIDFWDYLDCLWLVSSDELTEPLPRSPLGYREETEF